MLLYYVDPTLFTDKVFCCTWRRLGQLLYNPPIPEFAVVRTALNRKEAKATFDPIEGPSIILCTKGKGTISVGPKEEKLEEGYVFFVGATAEIVIKSDVGDEDGEGLVTFKAFCELEGDKGKL